MADTTRRARRVLLSGYYGFANAGDEAVLAGLILSLRAADPSIEVTALSINPAETERTHGVRAVHRYRPHALLPALARTDLLLSGGGSLLQDVTSAHGILYYLGVVRLAQRMGKRTMFGAQGLGPLERVRSRRLVASVANRLDAITVRDPQSAALLREIGVTHPPIQVAADPALLLGPDTFHAPQPGTYGVALRPWRGQESLATRLADACREALPQAHAVLFPMQPQTDTGVGEQFASLLHQGQRADRVLPEAGLAALTQAMGEREMMVGMRLHALILAAAAGVPSVALSYDPKVTAFMAQSGQEDAVCDLSQDTEAALPALLSRCWIARAERAEALRSRLPALRAMAGRTAEAAVSLLK